MALGDDEHPISFLFEPRVEGGHVKVVVRAGQRGHRALSGELTFRREEWVAFREALGSAEHDEDLAAMFREGIPTDVKREQGEVADVVHRAFKNYLDLGLRDAADLANLERDLVASLRRAQWTRATMATYDGRTRLVHLDETPIEFGEEEALDAR